MTDKSHFHTGGYVIEGYLTHGQCRKWVPFCTQDFPSYTVGDKGSTFTQDRNVLSSKNLEMSCSIQSVFDSGLNTCLLLIGATALCYALKMLQRVFRYCARVQNGHKR